MIGASLAPGDSSGWTAAYADAVVLALGGMPAGLGLYEGAMVTGYHGAGAHGYMLWCRGSDQAAVACGAHTDTAEVRAWASLPVARPEQGLDLAIHFEAAWSLGRMQGAVAALAGPGTLEIAGTMGGERYDLVADVEHELSMPRGEWMMTLAGQAHLALRDRDTREVLADAQVDLDGGWDSAGIVIDGVDRYRVDLRTGALCAEAAGGVIAACP